jgi:predicted RecA/RadA family phage recombinase
MASNYKQPGKVITCIAPSGGVVSGLPYMLGAVLVVALASAVEAAEFEGQLGGVWALPKTSAQAWAFGDKIYWNASTSKLDNVPTVGPLVGVATAIAANPTSTGEVLLSGVPADDAEGPQAAIADLALTSLTDSPATADALRDDLTTNWETQIEGKVNAILAVMRIRGDIAT